MVNDPICESSIIPLFLFLFYSHQMDLLSSKRISSPVPSLCLSNKDQLPLMYMSPRRAGCKYIMINLTDDYLFFCLGAPMLNR